MLAKKKIRIPWRAMSLSQNLQWLRFFQAFHFPFFISVFFPSNWSFIFSLLLNSFIKWMTVWLCNENVSNKNAFNYILKLQNIKLLLYEDTALKTLTLQERSLCFSTIWLCSVIAQCHLKHDSLKVLQWTN